MIGSVRSYLGAAIDGRADLGRGLEIAFRLHRFWAATNVAEGRFWLARGCCAHGGRARRVARLPRSPSAI